MLEQDLHILLFDPLSICYSNLELVLKLVYAVKVIAFSRINKYGTKVIMVSNRWETELFKV